MCLGHRSLGATRSRDLPAHQTRGKRVFGKGGPQAALPETASPAGTPANSVTPETPKGLSEAEISAMIDERIRAAVPEIINNVAAVVEKALAKVREEMKQGQTSDDASKK